MVRCHGSCAGGKINVPSKIHIYCGSTAVCDEISSWLPHAAPNAVVHHQDQDRSIGIDLSLGRNDFTLFALAKVLLWSKVDMTFRATKRADGLRATDGLRSGSTVQRKSGELHASLNIHSLFPFFDCADRLGIRVQVPTTCNDRVIVNNALSDDDGTLEAVFHLLHSYVGGT